MGQGTLIIRRKVGEKILISVDPSIDPQEALRWLIEEGIEVSVSSIPSSAIVRLSIRAPRELLVLREELLEPDRKAMQGRLP